MARHQLKLQWKSKRSDGRKHLTHEQFVHEVAKLGVARLKDAAEANRIAASKITYGAGQAGLRGITYFNRWLNDKQEQAHFVEICANGEESPVQLAGTTLHELGHVVAGFEAGHKKPWHAACERLGLRAIKAAGTSYNMAMFEPSIRPAIAMLIARLNDGRPNGARAMSGLFKNGMFTPKPCSAGIGTRGGKSRGVGSGSRLRKWVCACEKPQIVRIASDAFNAECKRCYQVFYRADE